MFNNDPEFEEALQALQQIPVKGRLHVFSAPSIAVLRGAWMGLTYDMIAKEAGYSSAYLRQDAGPKAWKLLSLILGCKVGKKNFKSVVSTWFRSDYGTLYRASQEVVVSAQASVILNIAGVLFEIRYLKNELFLH